MSSKSIDNIKNAEKIAIKAIETVKKEAEPAKEST